MADLLTSEVRVYAGFGGLRELRWKGQLTHLPSKGDHIVLPGNQHYEVSILRFLIKENEVEIYVR